MKDKIIAIGFSIIIIGIFGLSIILKDNDVSLIERRNLVTIKKLSKDFLGNIEDYLSDQFPLRNTLLSINSFYERYILGNKEKNDVYVVDDVIYEKNYPLDEKSIEGFVKKINFIKDKFFKDKKTYYTVIPDKSYFLDEDKYLKMDYIAFQNLLKDNINTEFIDLLDSLDLTNYYLTDILSYL